ncbi:MAG TPA: NAD-dependent epimerase/dehydratase family protein [Candidatus Kryptonia bacterium]|nr:NAD-dependent epimerase/dehydratase family protein [Candidatus Kryptonia bacterium]
MRVLVIGGTRFVGYQLVWRLLAGGHRVTILNRGTIPDPFGDRIERLIADRTTPDFARKLTRRRFDAVVDFAAFTGDDARAVVRVLGDGRVGHYVFISSGQVYLVRDHCPRPARESDYTGSMMAKPNDPADHWDWLYGVRKREAEDVLTDAFSTSGFPATRLRIPMVNGERDHHRRIESYLWRILDGGPVLLPDGGTRPMRHVYSGDVVRCIGALLGNRASFGEAYNLSQDEDVTLAELVAMLAGLVGAPARPVPVSATALRDAGLKPIDISPFSDAWMSHLDSTKARRELGFTHQPVATYMDKIVTSFLAHPPLNAPENYRHRETERQLAAQD